MSFSMLEIKAYQADAEPISLHSEVETVSATRCLLDGEGRPVFGEDVALLRATQPADLGDGQPRYIFRFWPKEQVDLKKQRLVFTTHPYSTDWAESAEFKKSSHRGVDYLQARRERVTRAHDGGRDLTKLKELRTDPFATGGACHATMFAPARLEPDLVTGRTSSQIGSLWGVCSAYEEVRRALELSNRLRRLVCELEDGTLYFQFSPMRLPVDGDGQPSARPARVPLHSELRGKGARLLDLAIDKALAGPTDGGEMRGALVEDLVRYIFLGQINNLNRITDRAGKARRPPSAATAARSAADADAADLLELSEAFRERLRGCDEPHEMIRLMVEHAAVHLESARDEDRLHGLAILFALRREEVIDDSTPVVVAVRALLPGASGVVAAAARRVLGHAR